MSAILSVDDLNDFISPGVACIKPVETLPSHPSESGDSQTPHEVTTEEQLAASAPSQGSSTAQDAQISLTDCLACSGCVTSAEAVLISLQSHQEVLTTLDAHPELAWEDAANGRGTGKVFVATVSPQTRANVAAAFHSTEAQAGHMIEHLFRGPRGLRSTGRHKSGFTWVLDTNTIRELCLQAGAQEVLDSLEAQSSVGGQDGALRKPILASSCPGWICYAEKTHPYVLPHLSRLKSPQAMTGIMVKSVLSQAFGIAPDKIWHLAVMPCFDKKLEASRQELTDVWKSPRSNEGLGVRDVDCVITAKELVMLAESRGLRLSSLPTSPVQFPQPNFPDAFLNNFLRLNGNRKTIVQRPDQGSSGGYAYHILRAIQKRHPGSDIRIVQGRNRDVVEYILVRGKEVIVKTARYYGFRNIQNLVRALKPVKASRLPGSRHKSAASTRAGSIQDYAYVEVMACPGGCTNGGGQIKAHEVEALRDANTSRHQEGSIEQKQWRTQVDEAYYSADNSEPSSNDESDEASNSTSTIGTQSGNQMSHGQHVHRVLQHWSCITEIPIKDLVLTSYQAVESNVGQSIEQVAATVAGGW